MFLQCTLVRHHINLITKLWFILILHGACFMGCTTVQKLEASSLCICGTSCLSLSHLFEWWLWLQGHLLIKKNTSNLPALSELPAFTSCMSKQGKCWWTELNTCFLTEQSSYQGTAEGHITPGISCALALVSAATVTLCVLRVGVLRIQGPSSL